MTHLPGTTPRAATRRRAAVLSFLVAVFWVALLAPVGVASATETDPPSTPDPPATSLVQVPVIEEPTAAQLVGDTIEFSGTAQPGAGIDLFQDSGGQPLCSVVASDSGSWSCSVTLESTPQATVRAVQTVDGQASETTVEIAVLNAPTAGAAGDGAVSSGTVLGTAVPGAVVTAIVGDVSCEATADQAGGWFCALPDGLTSGSYSLTASQIAPWSDGRSSASSSPVTLTIDVDAPAPPTVTIPASPVSASGALFSGEGEDGATVTVFAGPNSLCQAVVSGGRWSCTAAALDAGTYEVSAIQQDAAGNISDESARVAVAFGGASTPSPSPTPSPDATAPAVPPVPTGTPPTSSNAGPAVPDDDAAGAPDATGSPTQASPDAPVVAAQGGWSASTRFGAAMQPAFGRPGAIDWSLALTIGLAMVALLAVPARLLAGTLRGLQDGGTDRLAGGARFTGRNRSRHDEYDRAPSLPWNTKLTAAFAIVATAAITVLSAPVDDEPAYLRLLVAVTVGIVAVNAVAVLVPKLLARWIYDIKVEIRLRPVLLLVSVGATLLSRTLDLDPALVFGIVGSLALAVPSSRRATGRLAALQVGALLVVGATALLVSGSTAGGAGAIGAFVSEFVNTIALGSLGGAAFLLLPIASLPGRHIVRWRPVIWLLLAVAGFTLLGGVLSSALGGLGGGAGLIMIALGSLVFAAACVATWLWVRFIRSPGQAVSVEGGRLDP